MANIQWTGIENRKYGFTARWYVDAYYGNDNDVDGVGLYNASTNATGHGGPTRPFATYDKAAQQAVGVIVLGSGSYSASVSRLSSSIVGDGTVIFTTNGINVGLSNTELYNCTVISLVTSQASYIDCVILYSNVGIIGGASSAPNARNCLFIETTISSHRTAFSNCIYYRCTGGLTIISGYSTINNMIIDCPALRIIHTSPRPTGTIGDYSVIIGTFLTTPDVNGKSTGVTKEDFVAEGNYFVNSYSEVDLFGNVEGSGVSTSQLQTIFNNFFSPIYIDTYYRTDFSLKPNVSNMIKFGGLNGSYIGALPIGYHYTATDLWNTHRNSTQTSNLELDVVANTIQIVDGQTVGTYESNTIILPEAIIADPALLFANFVYNGDGTVKQGVANQRIDTTPDLAPDNTLNQRVVYDFEMAISSDDTEPTVFKNYELNREPTIDASGDGNIEDNFDSATETKQTIKRFKLRFTMRKIIIE